MMLLLTIILLKLELLPVILFETFNIEVLIDVPVKLPTIDEVKVLILPVMLLTIEFTNVLILPVMLLTAKDALASLYTTELALATPVAESSLTLSELEINP